MRSNLKKEANAVADNYTQKLKQLLQDNLKEKQVDIPRGAVRNMYPIRCWRCSRQVRVGDGFVFKTTRNARRWMGEHALCRDMSSAVQRAYRDIDFADYNDDAVYDDRDWDMHWDQSWGG